jgi:Zn-dependent peptidase ImmA (M78 family)/transcriptional regulator with XRE-family HTH domain
MSEGRPALARPFRIDRLSLARSLRGMSQRELAEAIGVKPPTLSQYESGAVRPPADRVETMAMVLGCSPEFFVRETGPSGLTQPFFRSLRSTPQKERDRAEAFTQLILELVEELERHVRLPATRFDFDFDRDAPSIESAEGAAELVRASWDLPAGPVGHVVRSLERAGVVVAASGSFDARLDAFSVTSARRPVVVLCSEKGVATRRRFDAAHELGHLVMHSRPQEANHFQEQQAHRFASALLMPREQIEPWLVNRPGQLEDLEDGARIWGVSIQALLRRSKDLGAISDGGYTRTMQRLSSLGWRTSEPVDIGPPERPQLLEQAFRALPAAGTSVAEVAAAIGIPRSRLLAALELPEERENRQAPVLSLS